MIRKGKAKATSSLFFDVIFVFFSIIYTFFSLDKIRSINIARVYVIPLLLFHAVQNICLSDDEIGKILKKIFINTWILCLYGIIQAYVFGSDFLIRLGYGTNENGLGAEFFLSNYSGVVLTGGVQRIISTFASANIFAFYLSMVFIIFLFDNKYYLLKTRYRILFLMLVGVTLILTFSRSSWLAIGIALIIYGRKPLKHILYFMRKYIILFAAILIIFIVVNEKIMNSLIHVILSSVSGTDTSMVSHENSKIIARKLLYSNPFGLGLGNNGPRALNYGSANLVESSYYLMMFEYGILGGLLYFHDYFYIFIGAMKRRIKRRKYDFLLTIVVFTLIAFANIPYIQEIECTSLFFIITGILLAQNPKEIRTI